ncbi:MAG: hypothetical protein Fur0032_08350 [Terrimicrobiaceae bacterium]
MAKTLCDWKKKDIEDKASFLRAIVNSPTHFCRRCARVANTPKVLCKARKFPAAPPRP